MKEQFGDRTKTFEWRGQEIEYKEELSLAEFKAFVDGVANGCFDAEGEYMPEFKDYLIRTHLVQLFTNVRMSQDIEKQYEILTVTDLADAVAQLIDEKQYFAVLEAIDEKISHIRDLDVQLTRRNIMALMAQFEEYGNRMAAMFDGIDPEDMGNLMKAVTAQDGVDEEKLVKAYLKETADDEPAEERKIVAVEGDET